MTLPLTALIPCKNDAYSLSVCLDSILDHVQCAIVFDDNSVDRLSELEWFLNQVRQDVRHKVEVIRGFDVCSGDAPERVDAGWCESRNFLLRRARQVDARHCLFIDADDILYESRVQDLEKMIESPDPVIRLGLIEAWGDFEHGTGRGIDGPHHDPCHIYVDLEKAPNLNWRVYGTFTRPETPVRSVRWPEVVFMHAKGVKSDERLVWRDKIRQAMAGGIKDLNGILDGIEDVSVPANKIVFGNPTNPIRTLGDVPIPQSCRNCVHSRFHVHYREQDPHLLPCRSDYQYGKWSGW